MDRISGPSPAPVGAVVPRQTKPVTPMATVAGKNNRAVQPARRFDTVLISESASTSSSYQMRLRSSVMQEVRRTGTLGNLSALRSQVQGGTYQADATTVARHMLRMPEEA